MVYEVRIQGVDEAARNIANAGAFAVAAQLELAHDFGSRVQAAVRGRSTGRPGPNRISGDYIDSIKYLVQNTAGGYEAVVAFWIRHALLPEERARDLVSGSVEDWLTRVQAVNGPLPVLYQEQHALIYLGALASEFAD